MSLEDSMWILGLKGLLDHEAGRQCPNGMYLLTLRHHHFNV